MPDNVTISRESFDEAAARMGINGSEAHMDELFRQVQGILSGARSLLSVDVSNVEPDMAFDPAGSQQG